MEIDNVIFPDLETLGKEKFFKLAREKSWIFVWQINILKLILLSVVLNAVYFVFVNFAIYIVKHNHRITLV